MLRRYLIAVSICLILVLAFIWVNISPTIKPGDIELKAILKNINAIDNPSYKDCHYVLDIELSSSKNHIPLNAPDEHVFYNNYLHDVYTYIDGYALKGHTDELVGRFAYGKNACTHKPMVTELNELGIQLKGNYTLPDVRGFSCLGNNSPAKIRFYLTNRMLDSDLYNLAGVNLGTLMDSFIESDDKPDLDKSYVVFYYYEKKWGRNLSWTKVIPIEEDY